MTGESNRVPSRPARMPIRSAILMSRGGNAWSSEIEDISATGVLVLRPEGWSGQIGDRYVLDMLIGESFDIHVEARLARIAEDCIGFAYERIPEDRETALWNLLGDYADRLEPYSAS